MTGIIHHESIQAAAEALARANRDAEPTIIRTYLFPSEHQIRLIHVDTDAYPLSPEDEIAPFYFGADSAGINYPSGVALVRPEDLEGRDPPQGWGTWESARVLWENRQ